MPVKVLLEFIQFSVIGVPESVLPLPWGWEKVRDISAIELESSDFSCFVMFGFDVLDFNFGGMKPEAALGCGFACSALFLLVFEAAPRLSTSPWLHRCMCTAYRIDSEWNDAQYTRSFAWHRGTQHTRTLNNRCHSALALWCPHAKPDGSMLMLAVNIMWAGASGQKNRSHPTMLRAG